MLDRQVPCFREKAVAEVAVAAAPWGEQQYHSKLWELWRQQQQLPVQPSCSGKLPLWLDTGIKI